MSSSVNPALSRAIGVANDGPMSSCQFGSRAANAHDRMKARGTKPSRSAVFSSMRITAEAPSVSGDELPAVIVPYLRSKTGLSVGQLLEGRVGAGDVVPGHGGSIVRSDRERHHLVIEDARCPTPRRPSDGSATRTHPVPPALMPFSFAMISADPPIVSAVERSAIAGGIWRQILRAECREGLELAADVLCGVGVHEDVDEPIRVEDRRLRHGFGSAGHHDVGISEQNRLGTRDDRLGRRCAGSAHRERINTVGHVTGENDLPCDVRGSNVRNDGAVDNLVDLVSCHAGSLKEFSDNTRGQIEGGQVLEVRSRLHKRCAEAVDDRDSSAVDNAGVVRGHRRTPSRRWFHILAHRSRLGSETRSGNDEGRPVAEAAFILRRVLRGTRSPSRPLGARTPGGGASTGRASRSTGPGWGRDRGCRRSLRACGGVRLRTRPASRGCRPRARGGG